jgi:hypothetical protein
MTFPNNFWTHHKVEPLSDAAFRAFVEMNGYSRIHDLDGIVPAKYADHKWKPVILEELVESDPERPLVLRGDGVYIIRDYAEHQQTTAERQKITNAKSIAGAMGAAKRWRGGGEAGPMAADSQRQSTETKTEVGNEVDGYVSSEVADATDRPELNQLLDLLDSEIRANGGKPPARTKKNLDAARLLIDRDKRTVEQVATAIRWCQADEFWRANILSMSKLREKYDQLRLAATRGSAPKQSRADENAADYYRYYGGNDERAGSVPALDPGVG